jgi:hypothetical protein
MIRRFPLFIAIPLAAASLWTASAPAQGFSLSPEIGFYIPTEKLIDAAGGEVGEIEAGPSFGLRLGIGLGHRVSLSVGGAYVPTTFAFSPDGGEPEQRDARLFNGVAQVMLYLIPPTSPLSLFVNGGVGVISRGGVAFTDQAETSDLSGVFGGGATVRLGGISLTAGADVFSYTAQYTGTGAVASELKQLDVQLRLGLGLFGGSLTGFQPARR